MRHMSRYRVFALGMTVLVLVVVAACGGNDSDDAATTSDPAATESSTTELADPAAEPESASPADFEETVRAARDEAQAAIYAAQDAVAREAPDLAREVFLRGPFTELLTTFTEVLSDYADMLLSALEAPAEHAADLKRQVDDARVNELEDDVTVLFTALAAQLSAEYAAFAYLAPAPSELDVVGTFGELSDEELAYLEGVQEAQNQFTDRVEEFERAISRT